MRNTLLVMLLSAGTLIGTGSSGPAAPPPNAKKASDRIEPPSIVKRLVADQATNLESEIANLALRRADVAGSQGELLEMMIDLRIIARTLIAIAVEAKAESELQIVATLRTNTVLAALGQLNKQLTEHPIDTLTPMQAATLKLVHQATYQLNDLKGPAQIDQLCRVLGAALASLAGAPVPPLMRPDPAVVRMVVPVKTEKPKRNPTAMPDAPRTLSQLEAEARQASVSVGLRRQLLALSRQTGLATGAEQAALLRVLADSVDLSNALAGNFAVDAETRQTIEAQLAEGIALFADSRLRDSGQKRLDDLNPYRQLLLRVGRMKLSQEVRHQLSAAFTWARANGQRGDKVLRAIEQFTQANARFGQIGRNPDLNPPLQKAADALEKKFAHQQQDFLNDAQQIGAGAMSTGPEELLNEVESLSRTAEALDLLNQLPAITQTLQPYRPKLVLGFQKRLDTLVATAQNDTPAADEAVKQLKLLDRITRQAQELSSKPPVDLTNESIARYGGDQLPAFDKKCQAMIGEMVQEIGTGVKIDESRLSRLTDASNLRDALQEVLLSEVTILRAETLHRWVDWPVTPAHLAGVLSPYQQTMSDAIAGFIADREEPLEQWKRMQGKYTGVLTFLKDNAAYITSCEKFPMGLSGEAGKLMTPFDKAPYNHQRYTGFMLICWSGLEQIGDADQADALAGRLAKSLGP